MENKIQGRNSSIELLRMLCMLLIVAHHYAYHGQWLNAGTDAIYTVEHFSLNVFFIQIMSLWGRLAAAVFIIISGYYLIGSKKIVKNKCKSILFLVLGYGILGELLYLVVTSTKISTFEIETFVYSLFVDQWFSVNYLVLLCVSPALIYCLSTMPKELFDKLLVAVLIFWSLIPTISFGKINYFSSDIDSFLICFCLGAYIKLYEGELTAYVRKKFRVGWDWIAWICVVFMIGSVVVFDIVGLLLGSDTLIRVVTTFLQLNRVPAILLAVALFESFKQKKFCSNMINRLSKSTFAVYLLHEGRMRDVIWNHCFANSQYFESKLFLVWALLKICVVFAACITIDQIRLGIVFGFKKFGEKMKTR